MEVRPFPDTLVGTDSHTTMVNGLAVLGWGVGGIEAEAAMLGQPISMLIPEVIGFRLTGKLKEGTTATDLVLTVTQMLRKKGVVGKFVEFFGPGLAASLARGPGDHRQHGARIWRDLRLFPHLRRNARVPERHRPRRELLQLVEKYCKAQGMFWHRATPDPEFTDTLELDLADRRALHRRAQAPAGPGQPRRRAAWVRQGHDRGIRQGRRYVERAFPSRAPISISAMAMWSSPPSLPAPTRRTRR